MLIAKMRVECLGFGGRREEGGGRREEGREKREENGGWEEDEMTRAGEKEREGRE